MGGRFLKLLLKAVGGIPKKGVSKSIDYLVIGAQSSPCWIYSTYGRKIENVIRLRERGTDITILHEDDFISQVMPIYNERYERLQETLKNQAD